MPMRGREIISLINTRTEKSRPHAVHGHDMSAKLNTAVYAPCATVPSFFSPLPTEHTKLVMHGNRVLWEVWAGVGGGKGCFSSYPLVMVSSRSSISTFCFDVFLPFLLRCVLPRHRRRKILCGHSSCHRHRCRKIQI